MFWIQKKGWTEVHKRLNSERVTMLIETENEMMWVAWALFFVILNETRFSNMICRSWDQELKIELRLSTRSPIWDRLIELRLTWPMIDITISNIKNFRKITYVEKYLRRNSKELWHWENEVGISWNYSHLHWLVR